MATDSFDKKTERREVRLTLVEATLMDQDADSYVGGNVSEMLRRAWRVWRGKQGAESIEPNVAAKGTR